MRSFIFFIFLITISSSCTKNELDNLKLKSPSKSYDLVIEGGINTLHQIQYIRLSSPTFDDHTVPEPVNDAKVIVNDGKMDVEFKNISNTGVYSGIVVNNANYNGAYKLKVIYKNKEYTAVDTLRQVINIIDDFLPFKSFKQVNNTIHLTIPKHTFGFLNPSKWLIAYEGIPLWNPSKFDSSNYSYTHTQGSPNSIYPLIYQVREADLKPNDFLFIYKFSLSDEYAKYLYSVFQETDWKGIFSSVPSEIKGNISEGAVGFFYTLDVDLRRYRAGDLIN
ncbi:MAG TPA: hypothetical protein DIT07_00630 [Sphingobacteriaceae bacterium]|nr:hypothetical protein [Sphingobacteriaceae bacterium]